MVHQRRDAVLQAVKVWRQFGVSEFVGEPPTDPTERQQWFDLAVPTDAVLHHLPVCDIPDQLFTSVVFPKDRTAQTIMQSTVEFDASRHSHAPTDQADATELEPPHGIEMLVHKPSIGMVNGQDKLMGAEDWPCPRPLLL